MSVELGFWSFLVFVFGIIVIKRGVDALERIAKALEADDSLANSVDPTSAPSARISHTGLVDVGDVTKGRIG